MYGEPRDCDLCNEPGARKVRIDIFPWMRKCVFVCAPCMKDLSELITELRAETEKVAGLTSAT